MSTPPIQEKSTKPVNLPQLAQMKRSGEKIVCLTAYDASFTTQVEQAGVEVILVGDSLGMVIQGHDSTVPVTVDDMIYHTRAVSRVAQRALVMADMPYMSYRNPEHALENAARLMQEGGAHLVKLEGGAIQVDTVQQLTARGIPVCAHIGLTPQSVHKLGGYRVQGRERDAAEQMLQDALALEAAGADLMIIECVPNTLAEEISKRLQIPVIGIGAGVECDGQVLVLYDMLGITPRRVPKFAKDFMAEAGTIPGALQQFVAAVKASEFPALEHGFS